MGLADIYDQLDADMIQKASSGTPLYQNVSVVDINKTTTGSGFQYAWWTRATAQAMAQTKIGSFICPSDTPYDKSDPFVAMIYWFDPSANTGYEGEVSLSSSSTSHPADVYGRTNYVGSAGFLGYVNLAYFDNRRGVFWNRSKTGFRDITDGSSKTLLFGETMGADTVSYTWFGVGVLATAFSMSDGAGGWGPFNSHHPKTVQFCMADGAVVPLSVDIDWEIYQRLGSIADDLPAEIP